MTIKQSIKRHCDNRNYCRIRRKVADDTFINTYGYIIDYSSNFILIRETDDFLVLEYTVIPISTIVEILHNKYYKYYDKIMIWEKQKENVTNDFKIDLTDWISIFKTIKKTGLNVMVDCEDDGGYDFLIGPITKITKTAISIDSFSQDGYFYSEPIKKKYYFITQISFDNRYVNIYSKYLRRRKVK